MAVSISKAQAQALAAGFFNSQISDDKVSDYFIRTDAGLVPKESYGALIELAGFMAATAQENLVKSNRVGSGELSKSIAIVNPEVINGKVMSIDIEANYYWKFVDGGVKGTKGGSGQYSFKNDFVGRKMWNAIYKWVLREGIRGKTDTKYKIKGKAFKRERFRKSISGNSIADQKSFAFAISKKIKRKGLRATNFLENAAKQTERQVDEKIGAAFEIDVIKSLPNKI